MIGWRKAGWALAALVLLAAQARAQGGDARAQQVLDRMLQRYQAGVANIEDYTVETDTHTIHYRKQEVDGWPSFVVHAETRDAAQAGMVQAAAAPATSLFDRKVFEQVRSDAAYEGRQRVDGRPVHAMRVDRIDGLFPEGGPSGAEDVLLLVDAQTLDLDRLRLRVRMPGPDGRPQAVDATIHMRDYRNVRGMMVPHRTSVTVEGLAAGVSDADRQQAQEALRQLEQVPPQQRAMVERMMQGQLEQARQVLSGEPVTFETIVRRVRVNTGLPGVPAGR